MLPSTTDVLIVGAGPAGLALAVGLTQQGRVVTVVDSLAAGDHTSRAAVVHAHTLEVLEPYGVVDRLVAQGVHTPRFAIRDRDHLLASVPFDDLPTAYPYTLMISQSVTEEMLLQRLTELGGKVLRPYTATALNQDDTGVTAILSDGQRIRAGYVVGADGMHSTVREQAGIGFTGSSYEQSFALADVRLSGAVPQNEVILYFSPAGLVVVAPLPGGSYRVVATVDDAPQRPDIAFVQQLLDTRGPETHRATVHEVLWGSRFRVQHRVADTYRAGRIVLVGDAAHVHSPAGGQGMNIGIADAVTLAEYLGAVRDGGSPDLLDTYTATRRPVAQQAVSLADRLTRLATVNRHLCPIRNGAIRLLARNPGFRSQLARRLSGLVYR